MLKREKILESFKIIFYLIILFNLKKINDKIKKLNLNYKFVLKKKKKKKEIVIRRRVNKLVSTKFFRIFVLNKTNFYKKFKKIVWHLKRSKLKSRFYLLKINKKFIKNIYICYFNFATKWRYYRAKRFDFIVKKKFKFKFKSKFFLDCVIKKNNYFYLYYIYYNKKLVFIANLERFKKNKFFFHKKARSYINKILLFYLIFILRTCNVKNINLVFFMKKKRRLNKKKYKIFTKTILDFKAFKHFFKLYKKLKVLNTKCNVKFKFIYNKSHSRRMEKLKKKRRK